MITSIVLALALGLAAWTAFASKQRWGRGDANRGLMSQQWIAEQRCDESRHRS